MKAYLIGLDSIICHKEHDELIKLGFKQSNLSLYTYKRGDIGILDFDIYVNDIKSEVYTIEAIKYIIKQLTL